MDLSLSSSSTLTNAQDQLKDNLAWRGDSAKAILFLEAVEWLLAFRAAEVGTRNQSMKYSDKALMAMREEASAAVALNAMSSTASPKERIHNINFS